MRTNKKFVIGIICVFLALALLIGSFVFVDWYQNRSVFTDKYGWVHNAEGTEYESDPYASLNYVIVNCDKKEFSEMTSHQFLNKITPVFKAYKGKTYVTFSFGDGTGIYWPYADKKYDGIYGSIDDLGHVTGQEMILHVDGNMVRKEEASEEVSDASVQMYQLLPEAYYTDNTVVMVKENVLYINVSFNAAARSYADVANELWNIYKKADLKGINIVLIRMNNDVFYEVNTMIDDSEPVAVENGYAKWEMFLYGETSENASEIETEAGYNPEEDKTIDIDEPVTTEEPAN